jgi:hypothetical protein
MRRTTRGARAGKHNAPPQGYTQLDMFEDAESSVAASTGQSIVTEARTARERCNHHLDLARDMSGRSRFQDEALANHFRSRERTLLGQAAGAIQ